MKIWVDKQGHINGVQAIYKLANGDTKIGNANVIIVKNDFTLYSYDLEDHDYLKQVSGCLSA